AQLFARNNLIGPLEKRHQQLKWLLLQVNAFSASNELASRKIDYKRVETIARLVHTRASSPLIQYTSVRPMDAPGTPESARQSHGSPPELHPVTSIVPALSCG